MSRPPVPRMTPIAVFGKAYAAASMVPTVSLARALTSSAMPRETNCCCSSVTTSSPRQPAASNSLFQTMSYEHRQQAPRQQAGEQHWQRWSSGGAVLRWPSIQAWSSSGAVLRWHSIQAWSSSGSSAAVAFEQSLAYRPSLLLTPAEANGGVVDELRVERVARERNERVRRRHPACRHGDSTAGL